MSPIRELQAHESKNEILPRIVKNLHTRQLDYD